MDSRRTFSTLPERRISCALWKSLLVYLELSRLVTLSLLVNEFTNSIKHGFAGREGGTISIKIDQEADRLLVHSIRTTVKVLRVICQPSARSAPRSSARLQRNSAEKLYGLPHQPISEQAVRRLSDWRDAPSTNHVTFPQQKCQLASVQATGVSRLGDPYSRFRRFTSRAFARRRNIRARTA